MALLLETHCHSSVSDGKQSPEEVVRAARARGLDALALTDHNTFLGSKLADSASKVLGGPLVVYGNEVRTTWGDVVVLCPSYPGPQAPRDPLELRDWASERNCIMIAVHPLNKLHHGVGWGVLRDNHRVFDAVEVWNAYTPPPINLAVIMLARSLPLARTSGSDAHVTSMLGVAPTIVESEPDRDSIIEAVRRGEVKPTYGLPTLRGVVDSLVWSLERSITGLRTYLQGKQDKRRPR